VVHCCTEDADVKEEGQLLLQNCFFY